MDERSTSPLYVCRCSQGSAVNFHGPQRHAAASSDRKASGRGTKTPLSVRLLSSSQISVLVKSIAGADPGPLLMQDPDDTGVLRMYTDFNS